MPFLIAICLAAIAVLAVLWRRERQGARRDRAEVEARRLKESDFLRRTLRRAELLHRLADGLEDGLFILGADMRVRLFFAVEKGSTPAKLSLNGMLKAPAIIPAAMTKKTRLVQKSALRIRICSSMGRSPRAEGGAHRRSERQVGARGRQRLTPHNACLSLDAC